MMVLYGCIHADDWAEVERTGGVGGGMCLSDHTPYLQPAALFEGWDRYDTIVQIILPHSEAELEPYRVTSPEALEFGHRLWWIPTHVLLGHLMWTLGFEFGKRQIGAAAMAFDEDVSSDDAPGGQHGPPDKGFARVFWPAIPRYMESAEQEQAAVEPF